MSRGKRESHWLVIRRCLAIVRRLVRGPASGQELISFVRSQVEPEAYSLDPAAARLAFKRDRRYLNRELGVAWNYDPSAQQYALSSLGGLAVLDLSDELLAALNVLYGTFEDYESPQVPVKPLLDFIADLLPVDRQRDLARLAQVMRVDMRELDEERIPGRVWQAVKRATDLHRQLAFNYYSPQQRDGQPRYWVVAPLELRFRRGHWYLACWELRWRSHLGSGNRPTYRRFRLRYIAADERLEVLPARTAVAHRRRPRYRVHYVLKPAVGRGDISRHFEEMSVERQPDGSAVVRGFCDDEWEAVRILLGYGENCVVLGGAEVVALMRRRVQGLAENYGFWSRS
jgi:predicted DNA-binding transcriptional regulator YafY